MTNLKAPIVSIVGRANVGKSSLFNAVVGKREAIVADEPGTTRSSVNLKASWNDQDFWLVDTAGLKNPEDDFELTIQEQIKESAESADLIVVVVEADIPPTNEDRQAAKLALKSRKPVLLVVNKIDRNKRADLADWARLGIKHIYGLSTIHKTGLDELLDEITRQLPNARIKQDQSRIKIGILGRPNAGKSSLFNGLANKQQAIVAERAGTTRDVNRLSIRYHEHEIELLDTAGIRRSGKIGRGVEYFSVLRALAVIDEADICLVLMDVSEPSVQLDQKIANLVKEAGKGLILIVSKWDSADKDEHAVNRLSSQIAADFAFVPWAPLVFTSAVSGQNLNKIFELALEISQDRTTKIKTAQLNRWLANTVNDHPPAGLEGRSPKLNYMAQEDTEPLPSFKIFGAHTKFLHWSYKRYMERKFREVWPLAGTPIRFWFIEKH